MAENRRGVWVKSEPFELRAEEVERGGHWSHALYKPNGQLQCQSLMMLGKPAETAWKGTGEMGAGRQVRSWVDIGATAVRTAAVRIKLQPPSILCPLRNCFSVPADTPKLEIHVNPTQVKEGDSVTMTCQVISSNPELRTAAVAAVSWFKDGRPLQEQKQEPEPKLKLKPKQEQKQMSKLTLSSVTKDMSGKYQCRASNDLGEGKSEEVGLKVLCEFP